MAELELSIKYRNLPARVGVYAMGALMPAWAIIIPFCLGLFISLLLERAGQVNPIVALVVLFILSAIPMVSVLIAAVCEDDRLLVSKEGISFPLFLLPGLFFQRERLWSDLSKVDLILDETISQNARRSGMLVLYFRSGGHSCLRLKSMSNTDIEQMLLSIEVWGATCERTPQLIAFQSALENEARGIDHLSYTKMWEEELSRRFSATAFIPLEPERCLQNKQIKILRQLAFGGLSAIYLAQKNGKELIVVKEAVVPGNADDKSREKAAELFQREANLLTKLNHPHIAKVLDHFQEDGRNYLVLQYINGQDLRQLTKQNGAQTEETVLNWAKQIASILAYLHAQSPPIIHRDLTPDNLVRMEDDTIMLIDFGAANEFVGTATGTLVGKQAYIAPEQLRGKATTISDIYAFGGTLFFLLTGRDPEALSSSHPKQELSSISDGFDKLVADCTNMDEDKRPQPAEQLIDRLIMIASDLPLGKEPLVMARGDSCRGNTNDE